MISIFALQNMRNMPLFFLVKSMLRKLLGFDHVHENKTFFVFLKEEINFKKSLDFF